MKNIYWIAILTFSFACQNGKVETEKTTEVTDTIKKDTVVVVDSLAALPELTGYAKQLNKKWKASEVKTADITLPGEIIDLQFDFKKDLSFEYSEDGKKDKGTWKISEDGKTLELTYNNKVVSKLDVKDLKEDKLILSGKEHGMKRTYTMAVLK